MAWMWKVTRLCKNDSLITIAAAFISYLYSALGELYTDIPGHNRIFFFYSLSQTYSFFLV